MTRRGRHRSALLVVAAAVAVVACGGSDDAAGGGALTGTTAVRSTVGSGSVESAPIDDASVESGSVESGSVESGSVGSGSVESGSVESGESAGSESTGQATSSEPSEVTTTAEADDSAERTRIPPRKGVTTRSPDAVGDGNPPENATTALVEIVDAEGQSCVVCMWLADEPDERGQGLMGVFDLGDPIGMAFRWDAPTSGRFFMFNTPTPLSIAWFAPDGSYLGEADMEPCLDETSTDCERYGTTGDYTLAIEMFQGELGKVGIGPGSTARIVETGESSDCPLLSA